MAEGIIAPTSESFCRNYALDRGGEEVGEFLGDAPIRFGCDGGFEGVEGLAGGECAWIWCGVWISKAVGMQRRRPSGSSHLCVGDCTLCRVRRGKHATPETIDFAVLGFFAIAKTSNEKEGQHTE